MKQLLLLFPLFFVCAVTVSGQITPFYGQVNLLESQQSLPDINVFLDGGKYRTVTDANGNFTFKDVPAGNYTLTCSGIGFKTVRINISVVKERQENIIIHMSEEIMELPTVEVSSYANSKGMMGSMSQPGSSHYISSREIKEINSTNPNEILERIPGIQLQEEDGFGLRPNIGLRASGSERSSKITVMEDDILSAPAPYAAPSAYYFPTMARMSGVEVQKGSAQIVNGPYTTGGVLNLISAPIPSEFKGKIKLGGGSFGSRNVHAIVGDKKGDFSYLLETFQFNAQGFKSIDFNDSETGFDKKDYLGKLRWSKLSDNGIFQAVQVKVAESREHSDETYLGLNFNDFIENPYRRYAGSQKDEMNTRHGQTSVKYTISPLEKLYIQSTVYKNTFSRNWYKLDKVKGENGTTTGIADLLRDPTIYGSAFSAVTGENSDAEQLLFVKANNRSYLSKGLQNKLNYFSENHSIEIGFRYHYDEMDRFQWVDQYTISEGIMELTTPGVQGTESNRIESATAIATYIQHVWKLYNLVITSGLRNEHINMMREDFGKEDPERTETNLKTRENSSSIWIPGLSLQYNFSASSQVFGGVHRGFAPQNSAPETQAELSVNYEVGYKHERSNAFISVVGFFNNYSNLLGSDLASSGGAGTGDLFNGGEVDAYGIEMAFNYRKQISDNIWIPISGQYTLSQASFKSDFDSSFETWGNVENGDDLPYLAHHTWNISSGLRGNNWAFNATGSYTSNMRTVAAKGAYNLKETIPGRFLLSSSFRYSMTRNVDWSIGVHNVLNRRYAVASRPAGWRPGAPRNINLSMEARF